ncbi:MAG: glycine cleavage system protein [Deltaproteobacteria bacterium]|nr:glycine cleavage system protein [Deltaproteobacteria bacterium]
MSAFLETTVDKFTFRVPTDRLYTADGMWVLQLDPKDSVRVRIGVTDFMQQHSGDVAFVTVRPPGTQLGPGDDVAEIETIKVNLALPSPVGGSVVEVNPALSATPEIINQDPYGDGWLAVIAVTDWEADRQGLLMPEAYFTHMQQQARSEVEDG